jgi:hypothetical protein
VQWWWRALEGVKKRYSGLGVSGYVKEKQEAEDLVERGMVFLDGVGWMDFAGTKGEELGVDQVYPVQGAEGVESVASTGEEYMYAGSCGI